MVQQQERPFKYLYHQVYRNTVTVYTACMDKVKATFMLSERTKDKLEALKARLRKAGIARNAANESAIVECLILEADRDFDSLLRAFS
jgi:hypothetical protein